MRRMFLLGLGVALAASLSLVSTRAMGGIFGPCLEYSMCANPADATGQFPYQAFVFTADGTEEQCQTVCEKWVTSCKGAASAASQCLLTTVTKAVAVYKAGCKTYSSPDKEDCLDFYNDGKQFCEGQIADELAAGKASCSDDLDDCVTWCVN